MMVCENCGGDSRNYRIHPDPQVCIGVLWGVVEGLKAEVARLAGSLQRCRDTMEEAIGIVIEQRDRLTRELAEAQRVCAVITAAAVADAPGPDCPTDVDLDSPLACAEWVISERDRGWACLERQIVEHAAEREAHAKTKAMAASMSEGIMQTIDASWFVGKGRDWSRPELVLAEYVDSVKADRDKWLAKFNASEQFQSGPTARADRAEAVLRGLREYLAHEEGVEDWDTAFVVDVLAKLDDMERAT